MEETNIIREWLGETTWYILTLVMPFFYAYLTSTAMLLYKVAKRKPDENGVISEFSLKYLIKDRGAFILSTGIFIFIGTVVTMKYFPKLDGVIVGVLVGVVSSYLGKLFEYLGESVFNRGKKEIGRINQDNETPQP